MAVVVGVGAGAMVGADRAGFAENRKNSLFQNLTGSATEISIEQHSVLLYSSAPDYL